VEGPGGHARPAPAKMGTAAGSVARNGPDGVLEKNEMPSTGHAEQASRPPILRVSEVAKAFGSVQALESASFDVEEGEICAFVGGNGAGKSTMVGILGGVHAIDAGRVEVDGEPVEIGSVRASQALGIEVVYQDLSMAPNMDAAFNLFLGRPIRKWGLFLDRKAMEARAREVLAQIHVSTIQDITASVDSLSGGQRQALAVGRTVLWRKRIVILDEPAAALGPEETEQVIQLIQDLRRQGSSVIVISHNMDHVFKICDRVVVFRHGRTVGQYRLSELDAKGLVSLIMLGE
jgi:ABC-type sugar transport system ATPase subunit